VDEPVQVLEVDPGTFECTYCPATEGKHVVTVTWGGYGVPRR